MDQEPAPARDSDSGTGEDVVCQFTRQQLQRARRLMEGRTLLPEEERILYDRSSRDAGGIDWSSGEDLPEDRTREAQMQYQRLSRKILQRQAKAARKERKPSKPSPPHRITAKAPRPRVPRRRRVAGSKANARAGPGDDDGEPEPASSEARAASHSDSVGSASSTGAVQPSPALLALVDDLALVAADVYLLRRSGSVAASPSENPTITDEPFTTSPDEETQSCAFVCVEAITRWPRYAGDRACLRLRILAGEHKGIGFTQGIKIAEPIWSYLWKSAGRPPPMVSEVARVGDLVGSQLRVRLALVPWNQTLRPEVKAYLPPITVPQ